MTVTPPAAYDATDLLSGVGIVPGQAITTTLPQVLAANHNHTIAVYTPSVFEVLFPRGVSSGGAAGTYVELVAGEVPENVDARSITFRVVAEHTNAGGAAGNIKCYAGANSSTAAVAAGAAKATYTITVTAPASGDYLVRVCTDDDDIDVFRAVGHYQVLTGAVSDTVKTSGVAWFQPATELASTEPFTTEMMNRLLEVPRGLYEALPWTMFSLVDDIPSQLYGYTTTSTSYDLVARAYLSVPYACTVAWRSLAVGPANSKLRVTAFGKTTTISITSTTLPVATDGTGVHTIDEGTMALPAGGSIVDVHLLSGTGGAVDLYSLLATLEV